ncbi:hypothetical protein BSLG_000948 [Batrachochytrium salamandrivorans]|nr:hypothetical protein BASA62_005439 [Batrachochytrium salamandrivorans]KAH9244432.1 hypothetical protein BASA81_018167 [Batrachochytrium salamandrivorans]KAH9273453.1 hypothetical protein BASA83_004119 [Batrachochytrium salamandrivorans]KAJ1345435.1 hypothetical protein BSLG_000948 [Batrachochytrium salamandrivorans]
MKLYWKYVVTPVVINIVAAMIRLSLISLAWNLLSWWARHFGVIRLTAAFHLKPIGTWISLLKRGSQLFQSPYASEPARSEVEKRRRSKRETQSSSATAAAIVGTLFLVILSICAQATDVLFSRFTFVEQGLYPQPTVPIGSSGNLSVIVPNIGINITYAKMASYCNPNVAILSCPAAGPWWDASYALMMSTGLGNTETPTSIPAADMNRHFSWTITGLVMQSGLANGLKYQIPQLTVVAVQTTSNTTLHELEGIPVAIPLADQNATLPISAMNIFEQPSWWLNDTTLSVNSTSNATTQSLTQAMIAETSVTFALPFDNGTMAGDSAPSFSGFGASQSGVIKGSWRSLLTQSGNLIGSRAVMWPGNASSVALTPFSPLSILSQNISGSASPPVSNGTMSRTMLNATVYGGALCAKANLRNGSTYEMIFVPVSNMSSNPFPLTTSLPLNGLRGLVWDTNYIYAHASPMYIIAKSVMFTDVMACQIYDAGLSASSATDSFLYLVSRCTDPTTCRLPTLLSVPRSPQPLLLYDFAVTVYNLRHATNATNGTNLESNAPTLSTQRQTTYSAPFYIQYTSTTGANVPLDQLWQYEPDQTIPGVCSAANQCYGSILPVWAMCVILFLLIITEISSRMIEELMDIVIYGFLSTTGPFLLALGPAVFSYDSLYLSVLTSSKAYVGVQSIGQHTASFHIVNQGGLGTTRNNGTGAKPIDHLSNPDSQRPLAIQRAWEAVDLAKKDKVQLKV